MYTFQSHSDSYPQHHFECWKLSMWIFNSKAFLNDCQKHKPQQTLLDACFRFSCIQCQLPAQYSTKKENNATIEKGDNVSKNIIAMYDDYKLFANAFGNFLKGNEEKKNYEKHL